MTERIVRLTPADFRVFEDGVEQTTAIVEQQRRPISLCIVLDASSSMAGFRKDIAQATVQATLAALLPDDEVSLIQFGRRIRVLLPWMWVSDGARIDWSGYKLEDKTVLIDATKAALALLEEARNQRTAVSLATDGKEEHSQYYSIGS